jgi:hypothetical protein
VTIELDHFFVITRPGAPEGDSLVALGLIEGTPNVHPGQGTANRRFFFANAMLELIYIRDAHEAGNGAAGKLKLVERSRSAAASPFGLVFRSTAPAAPPSGPSPAVPPFPGWRYAADYLPDGSHFHIGENADRLDEPLCIVMPADIPGPSQQPALRHPFTSVTSVRISVPATAPSPVLAAVGGIGPLSIAPGQPHLVELRFNGGAAGQEKDLRPGLPLIIRW